MIEFIPLSVIIIDKMYSVHLNYMFICLNSGYLFI